MDAEIAVRLDETRRRVELVADWMDRQARLVTERVTSVVERLEGLERDLREDLVRLRRALRSG